MKARPRVCGDCMYRYPDGSCAEHRTGSGEHGNIHVKPTSKACSRGLRKDARDDEPLFGGGE